MRTALGAARRSTPPAEFVSDRTVSAAQLDRITHWLEEAKAEDVVVISLQGKSSLGDYMVIASGRSDRHVGAIATQVEQRLKEAGAERVRLEGMPQCDWVVIDTGDIIVHIFQPEIRAFYNLEKMWSGERSSEPTAH